MATTQPPSVRLPRTAPHAKEVVPAVALDRNRAARAATRGLLRILIFFVLVVVLACGIDAAINHGLRSIQTSKFGAFNEMMQGKVNAHIVINGSSRALNHFDPRIIQAATGLDSYNIGMNASQIDLQLAILKTY